MAVDLPGNYLTTLSGNQPPENRAAAPPESNWEQPPENRAAAPPESNWEQPVHLPAKATTCGSDIVLNSGIGNNRKYSLSFPDAGGAMAERFSVNHLGLAIFLPIILGMDLPERLWNQWISSILLGAVNLEQTGSLDFHLRERFADNVDVFMENTIKERSAPAVFVVDRGIYGKEAMSAILQRGIGLVTWERKYKKSFWDDKLGRQEFFIEKRIRQFRPIYDNHRNDHQILRELSTAHGYVTCHADHALVELAPTRNFQTHQKTAIKEFLRLVETETNPDLTTFRKW